LNLKGRKKDHEEYCIMMNFQNLFSTPNFVRVMKSRMMDTFVPRTEGMRNAYKILVGKPKGKTPLRRPRSRYEDNIKLNPKVIVYYCMDWIHLSQDTDQWRGLVNTVMNLRHQKEDSNFLII